MEGLDCPLLVSRSHARRAAERQPRTVPGGTRDHMSFLMHGSAQTAGTRLGDGLLQVLLATHMNMTAVWLHVFSTTPFGFFGLVCLA